MDFIKNMQELCKKHNLDDLYDYIEKSANEFAILAELKNHKGDNLVNLLLELDYDDLKVYYCTFVEDNDKLWESLTSDEAKYTYCRDVLDREELWSTITDDKWKYYYCQDVEDRDVVSSEIFSKLWKDRYTFFKNEKFIR